MFCKKCVFTTFAKFTEKRFFEKFLSFRLATLIKIEALVDLAAGLTHATLLKNGLAGVSR